MNKKMTCGYCRWWVPVKDKHVCTCPDSSLIAEYTGEDETCRCWWRAEEYEQAGTEAAEETQGD